MAAIKYMDALFVLSVSFCTACLCEFISWILIYRTASYKALRSSIDKAAKKIESMKTNSSSSAVSSSSSSSSAGSSSASSLSTKKTNKTKKIDRFESSLKESSRDLSTSKVKSGIVVGAVLFIVFGSLNSLFEGKAVAKLPFVPVPFLQKMSHRGLTGDDATDCAMVFFYFLCSISIRTNLQKFLGFAPPRGTPNPGFFPMPDPKTN